MDLDKLLELSDSCIHDEQPICTATCPLHMDVIGFIREIEKGEFEKAYKIMEKRIPFTRIIGNICDHPCEGVCIRADYGGAIKISEMEKAAISYGYSPSKKPLPIKRKDSKIAVVGGGISGLVAANDLERKGYQITIFEKSDRLGGRFWDYEGNVLEKEIIEEEIGVLLKRDIKVKLQYFVDKAALEGLLKEFDAIYIGTGIWDEEIEFHPETFQREGSFVFGGGRLFTKTDSIIFSASSGRRAAVSIDRYIKEISMTASREREGSYKTPLEYKPEDEKNILPVEKKLEIYTEEEAKNEAIRCFKCKCRKCIDACSHLTSFDISPKSYMRQINQSERIILGTHYANKMINSCTMCGLCKVECFKDISMKDVIQETRESMVKRGKMPPSAHDFALKDMKFSNSKRFFMVKEEPEDFPKLKRKSKKTEYLFYPGCQLPASSPEYIDKIYKYLMLNMDGSVGIFLGCCGAPTNWGGEQGLAVETADKIKKVWEDMDRPIFILACSSCYEIFEKYLPEISCMSLWEIFVEKGLPYNERKAPKETLSIHDACATRYNSKIQESIRKIANSSGYKIEELKYSKNRAKCCGYGGLVFFANREQSKLFIIDRINETDNDLLVYCAMCKDLLISEGKRTYHILDLIYGEDMDSIALKKMPTLSERHKNRVKVKAGLLKEIWGEKQDMDIKNQKDFDIIIEENVIQLMEERYILYHDIEEVIKEAKISGKRFFNPENNNYLAKSRIDNVTYWVRYEEKENKTFINNVYCHRMEIVEE